MKFRIATLGCKVNQYESQQIRQSLTAKGFIEAALEEQPDITFINTCTVTHRSDADARRLIRQSSDSGRLIVTGCLASTSFNELKAMFPDAEVILKEELKNILDIDMPRTISSFSSRSRAFVKIQDGCSNYCSYCIVPFARGGPVSRPSSDIVKEINDLNKNGCSEVVICGINLGLYDGGIAKILKIILDETHIQRIRISSIEPWTLTEDFLSVYSNDRICSHIHLPVQSGSEKILSSMGRPYGPAYFSKLVKDILRLRLDTAIGTDIMAGFPGESPEDFQESLNFIEAQPIAYMHVFPFSRRKGTKAASFKNQVNEAEKKRRSVLLRAISEKKRLDFMQDKIGKTSDVIVTASSNGISKGLSSNYITAVFNGTARSGEIIKVRLESLQGRNMKGIKIG